MFVDILAKIVLILIFGMGVWIMFAFGFWLFSCGLKRIRKDPPAEKQ